MNEHDTNPEAQADQTKTAGPKETAFEAEIKPIWSQVWDLCAKHKINVVAGFALDDSMNTSISNTNDEADQIGGVMVGRAYQALKGGSPLDMLAALLGGR